MLQTPLPNPRPWRGRLFFLATAAILAAAFLAASPALAIYGHYERGAGELGGKIVQALEKKQPGDSLTIVEMNSCWTCDIFTQIYDLKEKFAVEFKFPIQDKLLSLLPRTNCSPCCAPGWWPTSSVSACVSCFPATPPRSRHPSVKNSPCSCWLEYFLGQYTAIDDYILNPNESA